MEEWKDIEGFTGYQVSNMGRIWSDKTNRYLSVGLHPNGYKMAVLYKDGVRHQIYVHIIVATAFISNHDNKPCVDHINGVRGDNRAENLRWCTYEENCNFPLAKENRRKGKVGIKFSEEARKRMSENRKGKGIGSKNPNSKEVVQLSNDGELIRIWDCIKDAQDELGTKGIYSCLSCACHTSGGYRWVYKKDWEAC